MEENDGVGCVKEIKTQEVVKPGRKISRRLVVKTGLGVAGVSIVDKIFPPIASAQTGELKPIPGISPIEAVKNDNVVGPYNITIIRIDSDADSAQSTKEQIVPYENQQELEKTSAVVKNFFTEKIADVKVKYRKGNPIAAHAIVHANQPELDVYTNGNDATSLEYAKLVGGMGYGKIVNMANNGEAVEQFNAHVQRTANIDLTAEDKRLNDLGWLFDISNYIKGPQKEYSDISSGSSEKLFMHCFSLIQFRKAEVLERLKKNILDNEKSAADKKRGAGIFLSAIETMMDLRTTDVTLKDLKLDTMVKELSIILGKQTIIAGY